MEVSPSSLPSTPKQTPPNYCSESESDNEEQLFLFSPRETSTSPTWPRKPSTVKLEGYTDVSDSSDGGSDGGSMGRAKSLTDDDLEDLKGCLDLGFGFSYEEIPELCSTLPALELCYSMSQRFWDEKQESDSVEGEVKPSVCSTPVANWRISQPGDDPKEVKARLRYWAQAVACTVRLCN
ncbi:hypothetical protein LUZ60_001944 [Juncus effusus]|nr:hypothetical protein LUZ60_001944 [Juncus effusus]